MSEESLEGLKMCGQRNLLINIGKRVKTRGQMFDEGVNEVSILIFMGITVLLGRQSLPLSFIFPDFPHTKASRYVEYWADARYGKH